MHPYKNASTALLLLGSFLSLLPAAADAQSYLSPDPPPHAYDDRFRLEVDLLFGGYDTSLRLDRATTSAAGVTSITPGTTLSAENDLALAKSQLIPQLELTLLPGKHHVVRLGGLSMRRSGSTIVNRTINFGSSTYTINDRVDSHLNVSMIGLTYGYLPFRADRYELGLSFGIQISSIDANAEVRTLPPRNAETGVAPVPLLGIEGRFDFTRRWSVDARYQYMTLSLFESLGADLNNVAGTITDGRFALRFRQNQHLIYGLGYRYFNLDVNSADSDTPGQVQLKLGGPVLFVQGSL